MCTQFTNETVSGWLNKQIAVLDCWLDSESLNPTIDMRLMETLQTHKNWLEAERNLVSTLSTHCISMEAAE